MKDEAKGKHTVTRICVLVPGFPSAIHVFALTHSRRIVSDDSGS
jgi:hypothetical protein